jgi:hypothetical protein
VKGQCRGNLRVPAKAWTSHSTPEARISICRFMARIAAGNGCLITNVSPPSAGPRYSVLEWHGSDRRPASPRSSSRNVRRRLFSAARERALHREPKKPSPAAFHCVSALKGAGRSSPVARPPSRSR